MDIQKSLYETLCSHLNTGNLIDFLSTFHSLHSPEEKAAYLAYDGFTLLLIARATLSQAQFAQLQGPLNQQLNDQVAFYLLKAVESKNFNFFMTCYSCIQIQDRISVLLQVHESKSILTRALEAFTEQQCCGLLLMFPPMLAKMDTEEYQPPLGLSPLPSESPHFQTVRLVVKEIFAFKQSHQDCPVTQLLTHLYTKMPPELFVDKEFEDIALTLPTDAFIEFVESVPTRAIMSTFFYQSSEQVHSLMLVLEQHGPEALQAILLNLPRASVSAVQKKLLSEFNGQTLCAHLQLTPGQHHEIIQDLVDYDPNQSSSLQAKSVTSSANTHDDVGAELDDDDPLVLPPRLSAQLDQDADLEDSEPTPDKIFKQSIAGDNDSEIVTKLRQNFRQWPLAHIVVALNQLSPRARFSTLTANAEGECLLEKIVKHFFSPI